MRTTIDCRNVFDPTDYADPLFEVGSATSAGPTRPAGSIHPSPETLENDCGGYLRGQPIVGFGHAYTSGAGGTKCYGNFLLTPILNKVELDRNCLASYSVKGSEKATCYEYSVTFENGISTKVTPAHSAAIYTFEYPKNEDAYLILDVAHKFDIDASIVSTIITTIMVKRDILILQMNLLFIFHGCSVLMRFVVPI